MLSSETQNRRFTPDDQPALKGFPPAGGLSLDTPVPTPAGWTSMGNIQAGDTIFDDNGQRCCVTHATEIQFGCDCFEVEFDDGTKITVSADHNWTTDTHASRRAAARRVPSVRAERFAKKLRASCEAQVRTTQEIRRTLNYGRERNHSINVCKPLAGPEAYLLVEPYLLGCWLGDGDKGENILTCADPEIIDNLQQLGHSVGEGKEDKRGNKAKRYTVGVRQERLRRNLRKIGVLSNKHIPVQYLRGSIRQRTALLMGLMDTDGSVSKAGHSEFSSTIPRLAADVMELIASLGIKVTIAKDRAKYKGKMGKERYRITFTAHKPVCRLDRKLERQHSGKRQAQRILRRYVVAVREVPSVPVRGIQVNSFSGLFLCSKAFIPTRRSLNAAARD